MLNFYHESGKLSLFTNLRVPSLMSSLKALLILVCLQFACTSAMAQCMSVSATYDVAKNVINVSYKNGFVTYRYGYGWQGPGAEIQLVDASNASYSSATPIKRIWVNGASGNTTIDASDLSVGSYVIRIECNGTIYSSSCVRVDRSLHKLTGLRKSGNYVIADFEKGPSSRGGYTVMRLAASSTGRVYNEVPLNSDGASTGSVSIYCEGPQFKSDIYIVYLVVDGKVCDSKKIQLYYY